MEQISREMRLNKGDYLTIKEKKVQGRYIVNEQILDYVKRIDQDFQVETLGNSVDGRPIKMVSLGKGPIKILMWSQMHGNESTTTKAVLDFINFFGHGSDLSRVILKKCTIKIIPMLNPDGAAVYKRVNANQVDLNRDAQQRTQPESMLLRKIFDDFRPDFCFNLHDQRTIFNVGNTSEPATVSFLAPALDEERSISKKRGISMQLIAAMNSMLQQYIPGRVGRYDDGFNANCVGDTFQMLHAPTVLFEAGHSPGDYQREQTRMYIFQALLTALEIIAEDKIGDYRQDDYFAIPENQKCFYDILIKNANIINPSLKKGDAIGILYKEVLIDGVVNFIPQVEKKGKLKNYFGHIVYDCSTNADIQRIMQQPFYSEIIHTIE